MYTAVNQDKLDKHLAALVMDDHHDEMMQLYSRIVQHNLCSSALKTHTRVFACITLADL